MEDVEMSLPPAMRFGDHPALDFLNTVAAPKGEVIEWVGTGRQLLAWMAESGMLNGEDLKQLEGFSRDEGLNLAAHEAMELREWFRDVLKQAKAAGRRLGGVEVMTRLNGLLKRDESFEQLEQTGGLAVELVRVRRWRQAGAVLAPIAEALADLICEGDFAMVRKCENPACTMWFYDRTKGHRRRWCSQAICGNRAKVAAYRERQRAGQSS